MPSTASTANIHPTTEDALRLAGKLLQDGKLVAFPTETVYGLGANACDEHAVAAIFAAKGRPSFNPLIVHVASLEAAQEYGTFNQTALKLANTFWPGALTLVVPRRQDCALSLLVSAGLDSVALRVPNHPTAQKLLHHAKRPIAAPSANKSGSISPTHAQHVAQSLGARVDMILDDGACGVGLESTVIDVCGPQAGLLRPGGLAIEDIEALVGPLLRPDSAPDAPKSPGMLTSHYAPDNAIRLNATSILPNEAWLGFGPNDLAATLNLSPSGDLREAAANLFAMMRSLDDPKWQGMAVSPIPMQGLGLAINDRLNRAAAPKS